MSYNFFYLEIYVPYKIYAPADYVSVYSEHLGFWVPNRCIERKLKNKSTGNNIIQLE